MPTPQELVVLLELRERFEPEQLHLLDIYCMLELQLLQPVVDIVRVVDIDIDCDVNVERVIQHSTLSILLISNNEQLIEEEPFYFGKKYGLISLKRSLCVRQLESTIIEIRKLLTFYRPSSVNIK